MKQWNEPIVVGLPWNWDFVNVYIIGDKHIGSQEFNIRRFRRQIDIIKSDPHGVAVICGDLLDFGIIGSKTPTYGQRLMPSEQKDLACEMLETIADKLIAINPGNHEERGFKATGVNPLYDVACRLRREDYYRNEACAVIIKVGTTSKSNRRQSVYGGVISHGSSVHKHHRYCMAWDGVDFFISGHTHTPSYTPRGKRRLDINAGTVRVAGYKEIIADPGLNDGGYVTKQEYEPAPPAELQKITLYGNKKRIKYSSDDGELFD